MDRNRLKTFVSYAFCMAEYTSRVLRDSPSQKKDFSEMGLAGYEEANPGLFFLNEAYDYFTPLCDLSKKEFKSIVDEMVIEKRILKTENRQYPLYKAAPPKFISDMSPEELAEYEAKYGPAPKPMMSEFQSLDLQTGDMRPMTAEEIAEFKRSQEKWAKMTPEERKAERAKPENQPLPLPASFPHPDKDFYE